MREIKTVTLIGLGAMGAYFTPGLCAALGPGFRVMAEGERKKRLEKGVIVNGVHCTFPVVEPGAPSDPADLIVIAVKDYALPQALAQIAGHVGPDTILLPVLNGLDCARQTGEAYGMEKVLYASMWVPSSMENGIATFPTDHGLIRFGEAKNETLSPRVQAVAALFERAGIPHTVEPDMIRCLWVKFMGNVSENLPCALLGVPYGAYQNGGPADPIRRALAWEVLAVANAAGIALTQEDIALRDKIVSQASPDSRPSTLQDLDRGKRTEVDMLAGAMVRLGEQYGIPTPVSRVMLSGIKTLEAKQGGLLK